MNNLEYKAAQDKILLLAQLTKGLDIAAFLSRIEHTDAVAPIVDPTLYMKGMERLHAVKKIASALQPVQAAFHEFEALVLKEATIPSPPIP